MSCCGDYRLAIAASHGSLPRDFADQVEGDGPFRLLLSVPDMKPGDIGKVERALHALPGLAARVNFSRRTVALDWADETTDPGAALVALRALGHAPRPATAAGGRKNSELLRCLAVAGFAAMNVMLLSVAVWSGADGTTRATLNWFSALIALPALAYAARPFVRSAVAALREWRLNMDVPITVAIVLAAALSLTKTITGEGETYFDAAITLTFFLLAGRTLDHMTREKARASLTHLATLRPLTAALVDESGTASPAPLAALSPGSVIEVAAGERIAVDGVLQQPATIDASLATGESEPVQAAAGDAVLSGTMTLTGPVRITATAAAEDSFVARLTALQAAAESARARPARIADRAAKVYAPLVHGLALAAFVGWMLAGATTGAALTIAVAVLIITCPCALGLAVPVVHVSACDRLFRMGLALKDGGALERLREIDEVVFDKTGTLTVPEVEGAPDHVLAAAAALARHSTHPVARAVSRAAEQRRLALPAVTDVMEVEGRGISGRLNGERIFLGAGAPQWAGAPAAPGLGFYEEQRPAHTFAVRETLRPGAKALVASLAREQIPMAILSGDRAEPVERVARILGITRFKSGLSAADKVAYLHARAASGGRTLVVGDGLNDGPALAAAHASVAPAEASDLSRAAADIVLMHHDLSRIGDALDTAHRSHRLILQNFAIAAAYNTVAIPLAVAGYATPLAAAIAMSTSSILVTLNALRLSAPRRTAAAEPEHRGPQARPVLEPAL